MGARFRYSRWDGTQQGFELDADSLLKELTDELIHHGDPNAALRRIMQQGLRDRNGRDIEGVRDALKRLRERREQLRESGRLGGEFDEFANELDDIVDEERLAAVGTERREPGAVRLGIRAGTAVERPHGDQVRVREWTRNHPGARPPPSPRWPD